MNKKGMANIISYLFYILIAIVVLSIVATESIDIVKKNQDKYKYNNMINSINLIDNTINKVSHERYSKREIIVNNIGQLLIDCENNRLNGSIVYSLDYRTDQNTVVQGVTTYKELNNLYFEKSITDRNIIDLDCNSFNLNIGKNIIDIYYSNYENNVITIDINRPSINITVE